jgi:peptidyl-prolyl isomerase D
LKEEEEALKDLQEATKLAPTDAGIINEIAKVKKSIKDRDAKDKAAARRFFS